MNYLKEKISKLLESNEELRINKLIYDSAKKIVDSHNHYVVSDQADVSCGYAGARCIICNNDLGWYCPKSPDHLCNYYGIHGDNNYPYLDEDDCIYCHEPEERK